jgi:hypothetical protein
MYDGPFAHGEQDVAAENFTMGSSRPLLGFRAVLAIAVVLILLGVGAVVWWEYTEQEREIARLREAIGNLTASYPIARVVVLGQMEIDTGETVSNVRVVFLDEEGRRHGEPVEAALAGTRVYFEALLLIFGDQLVESGEQRAMAFPTRVFTEEVPPREGVELSVLNDRGVPVSYAQDEPPGDLSAGEYREVLQRFWELANDPDQASALGISVLQGEAVFTEYQVGRYYQVFVEADGGLTIRPEFHWVDG